MIRYDTTGGYIDNEAPSGTNQEDAIIKLLDYAKVAKRSVNGDKATQEWSELYDKVSDEPEET